MKLEQQLSQQPNQPEKTTPPPAISLEKDSSRATAARGTLFQVGEKLIDMSPKQLDQVITKPESLLQDPGIATEKSVSHEIKHLKQRALAYGFEDGYLKVAKKFKEAEKFAGDEKKQAGWNKGGIDYLQTMIDEWQSLQGNPKVKPDKKNIIPELISQSKKLIEQKKPQSVFVSKEQINNILDDLTRNQDKSKARSQLKGFMADCNLRLQDKSLDDTKKKEIQRLQTEAQSYLVQL